MAKFLSQKSCALQGKADKPQVLTTEAVKAHA